MYIQYVLKLNTNLKLHSSHGGFHRKNVAFVDRTITFQKIRLKEHFEQIAKNELFIAIYSI